MAPRLLTSPQAAERLGLPVQALYKLRDADEGLAITQTGLQVGYQLEDIQAYERREMLALVEKTLAAERPLPLIRAMAQLLRSPPPADGWPVPTPSPKPKPLPPSAPPSAPPKRVLATEPAAADAPVLDPPAPAVHTPPSSIAWFLVRSKPRQESVALTHLARQGYESYWSARLVAELGQRTMFRGSDRDATDELERLIRQSIAGQMLADVPLGAFLSGGIDSTTVVALMQAQSARSVKTFTIGFNEGGYNEAEHAHAVARHLGCEHTELYVSPQDAMDVIPSLSAIYDEPFADSSQIPTYLVSTLARRHVTVSLSGDGGDELFGGYNRYLWVRNLWRNLGWMPRPLRAALAGVLTTLPPAAWNTAFSKLERWLPLKLRYANPGDKLHKVAEILAVRSPEEIYLGLVSHWKNPTQLMPSGIEPLTLLTDIGQQADLPDFEHRMMYLDTVTYLPDDVLTKVDRAAMAVSLETRVPFLDHRLVEFAWSLPLDMKIRHGQGKWLLRQLLYRHVPQSLMDRPKMGFGVPIDQWLRGPLKPWAAALIEPARLTREGFFDPVTSLRVYCQYRSSGSRE